MNENDLNLENYDLEDILKLFKLPYNFTKEQLKKAQKIVYLTHPDKSNLPKEYFLFYIKAFKVLKQIYDFRFQKTKSTNYEVEKNEEHEILLEKIKHKKNFNKWFNEMFENVKMQDNENDNGYGNWLSSNENINNEILTNPNNMNEMFEKKKTTSKKCYNNSSRYKRHGNDVKSI